MRGDDSESEDDRAEGVEALGIEGKGEKKQKKEKTRGRQVITPKEWKHVGGDDLDDFNLDIVSSASLSGSDSDSDSESESDSQQESSGDSGKKKKAPKETFQESPEEAEKRKIGRLSIPVKPLLTHE